jgi:cell wall-associated NlpC family hydrolase
VRVVADSRRVEVEPGGTATVGLDVVNTADVADALAVNVIGIPADWVSVTPQWLPLAPNAGAKVTVALVVPPRLASGRHRLAVEVVSHGTASPTECVDIDLDVVARPELQVQVRPDLVRARRSARFVVELVNAGNVAFDAALSAHDSDRGVQARFIPQRRHVEPGGVAAVFMAVHGRRMITGVEVDRSVTVEVRAAAVNAAAGAPATVELANVVLRQRPLVSRRLATGLTLLGSVAAAACLVWFGKVSSGDAVSKQVPASFFAQPTSAGDAVTQDGQALAAFSTRVSSAAPPGALPKTGQLPPGVGGDISGSVAAVNDDAQPVGGIRVQAYRMGPHGLVAMGSTTSQADGSYTLAGLFPVGYYLKFSGAGYVTRWYPERPTHVKPARPVTVTAQGVTADIDARIATQPASISGTVRSGDALTTVTVRPLLGPRTGQAIATATVRGGYRLGGLPAPGAYELTFTAPGFQDSTLVDAVGPGQQRLEPAVVLGAGFGQISGIISDGTQPLAGANVRTMVNGTPLDVITPDTGPIGAYTLPNLPTPATYVITYSSPGHGTVTQTVDLAAGQRFTGLNVSLAPGPGGSTQPLPAADPAPTGSGETEAERIAVTFALAQLGKPYVFDAAGPNAYDCSGLTMAAWAAAGVTLPHNAAAQWHEGTAVPDPLLLVPGDLIFIPGADGTWNPPHPGHVGMYIGGGYVIEAPQTGDVVKIVPLSTFGPIIGMRHYA